MQEFLEFRQMDKTLIVAIGGFIFIIALLVTLRVILGSKFEIKTTDIILALIPIIIWLFLSGKISELTIGDLTVKMAIQKASKAPIKAQVTELPVETVLVEAKEGVELIPHLVMKKTQALGFRLGTTGYWGPAIGTYLQSLTQYPFFQYIVINDADGRFFGLADAHQLEATIRDPRGAFDVQSFAEWLNHSNREQLQKLPGFISSANAIKVNTDKRSALELMEKLDVRTFPVIDDSGKFVGIVDRSKLTASILLEMAEILEEK